ncbi:ABC transporter permease [Spirosoma sp. SC4-14]|uniref:ABC transporter permease n=1 Tax=Spirosoma sp. SC4-14 TaxID=3128900 RepID=UPI0030CD86E7
MSPLSSIIQFEFRYQFRQPTFYLFIILTLMQGYWSAYRLAELSATGNPVTDAYAVLSSFGLVLAIVTVLIAGQSLTKDWDFRTTPYLYSLPITSRTLFSGRLLGSYGTALAIASFYSLGIVIHSLITLTAIPWLALLDGFVRLLAPNSFVIVCLTFSLTVFLRSIRGAYVSLFAVALYFLLAQSSTSLYADSDLRTLLDPFGVSLIQEALDDMLFLNDAHTLFTFSDLLFINRLLWIGIALGVLAQAESQFSFNTFSQAIPSKRTSAKELSTPSISHSILPKPHSQFGRWQQFQVLVRLSKFAFLNLIRQPAVQISVGLLAMLALLTATILTQNPNFPELPTTAHLTALRLSIGTLIGLFLVVMTGELLFQERTVGFWSIYDALPQSNFVLLSAKIIAMGGLALLLTATLFLTGIGIQLYQHFYEIDWRLYASDLLMDGFLRYCQLIIVGALVAVLLNNRFLSHFVNLILFGALTVAYQTSSPAEAMYLYSFLPGSSSYSDLIGYGANAPLRPVFHLIWWSMAGLFITLLFTVWNRGVSDGFRHRLSQWRQQFSWQQVVAIAVSFVAFGAGIWQLNHQSRIATTPLSYTTQTLPYRSVSGKTVRVQVQYHHPYQVRHILMAAKSALMRGEQLFGAYPYTSLEIRETPLQSVAIWSKPGKIQVSEKEGWLADYRQPQLLDYIDYVVSREVFKQWLVHRLHPAKHSGKGFLCQSLPEYLALQEVARGYGAKQLAKRLAQRKTLYASSHYRSHSTEVSLLQSDGNDALERGRGALALTSIGQVWGDAPLSLTIGQFYRQAIRQPGSATATAFSNQLTQQLPDSLRYLNTYLRDPVWFVYKIGRVANMPNGLVVEIVSSKWQEKKPGQRTTLPINDRVPVALLDKDGHEIYRQLVYPNPDKRDIWLPLLPNATLVAVDPLGAWPEMNKRDNYKIL